MEKLENLTHQSVLPKAAVCALLGDTPTRQEDRVFVDATFGYGGHSRLLLENLSKQDRLVALDCDEFATEYGKKLQAENERFIFMRRNFVQLGETLKELDIIAVNGVLFDLGLSSMQLDSQQRGFSFRFNAPLDMRFDQRVGKTAKQWLMESKEEDIISALRLYGEEPESKRIGRALFAKRKQIETTADLAQAVIQAKRFSATAHKKHPATKVFQAIRIAVNDELICLQKGLEAAIASLMTGGRLVVIAFHSLEDRIVKRLAQGVALPGIGKLTNFPLQAIGKNIVPDKTEVSSNLRARSAKMRVFMKTADTLNYV